MTGRWYIERRRRGLTLLEVVLAMSLLVVLSTMTYWFYSSSLETRERGMKAAQRQRLVRVILDRIAAEIRQASAIGIGQRAGIRGEAERIWLTTMRVPSKELSKERRSREEPPPGEYDLAKVAYHIVRHPDIQDEDGYDKPLGLARVEITVPRPDSAETGEAFEGESGQTTDGEESSWDAFEEALLTDDESGGIEAVEDINWQELYSTDVRYLRFCYFDGNTWWDEWDVPGENALPQMVMVTLGFSGQPPCGEEFGQTPNEEFCECLNRDPMDCERLPLDQYTRVVRVTQADPLFRSRVTREGQELAQTLGASSGKTEGEEEGD